MAKNLPFVAVMAFTLFLSTTAFAKIWRVNNNSGVAADFTTLQAAHNSASDGDTLHFEGSPFSYGGATLSKKTCAYWRRLFP